MLIAQFKALPQKQQIIAGVWLAFTLFSLLYIFSDVWTGFRIGVMQNSYNAGKIDTVNALIDQAANKDCKPFNVYAGERKVDLVNAACVSGSGSVGR